jgi:hypothetical protein
MKNPNPVNLQSSAEVRERGWQAESRDADGHLISCHAPIEADDPGIAEWIVECTSRGETVTFWPISCDRETKRSSGLLSPASGSAEIFGGDHRGPAIGIGPEHDRLSSESDDDAFAHRVIDDAHVGLVAGGGTHASLRVNARAQSSLSRRASDDALSIQQEQPCRYPPPSSQMEPVEIPGELEMFEGKLTKVVDASRTGWWRFHAHRDRDGYCDNPARGY